MKKYKTIYGEIIKGKIVKSLINTVIVENLDGLRYLVHKKDIKLSCVNEKFDLDTCQKIGRQPDMEFWR